jgi:hypothetical protein
MSLNRAEDFSIADVGDNCFMMVPLITAGRIVAEPQPARQSLEAYRRTTDRQGASVDWQELPRRAAIA